MLADFGETVMFTPSDTYPERNDNSRNITAIFDNEYIESGGGLGADQRQPVAVARSIDVADAQRGSMLELESTGAKYRVIRPEPDGTGVTYLILEGPH